MNQLYLASQSPRRMQLLEKSGFSFISLPLSTSETFDQKLIVDAQILSISRLKLVTAEKLLKSQGKHSSVVITADTEVVFQDQLMGKPNTKDLAHEMLRRLSGHYHYVKTAVMIKNLGNDMTVSHIETSSVLFKPLSDQIISDYVNTGDPMDKAGAYGIQGLGRQLVESFSGSFDNIVGLPVEKIHHHIHHLMSLS